MRVRSVTTSWLFISRALLSAFACLSLTACLGGGKGGDSTSPSTPNESACAPTTHSFEPAKIQGHKHLYFDASLIAVLDDPDFTIDSASLSVSSIQKGKGKGLSEKSNGNGNSGNGNGNAGGDSNSNGNGNGNGNSNDDKDKGKDKDKDKGKEPKEEETVSSLSLNGMQVTEALGAIQTTENGTVYHLHKMRVNGAEPVLAVMGRIRRNKGEIRFSVMGKSLQVESASLVITGHRTAGCGGPSPTPTPVPPIASITGTAPSEAITSSTGIEIAFIADQPSVNFSCSLDSSPFTTCLSPIIYASLSNGSHSFRVKATNSFGLESEVVSHQWTVDTVAPSVTIESVASPTNQTSFLIPFTSDDAGTFSCVLDGGDPYPCSSPVELLGLGEGDHSLAITATDALGNRGVPAHVEWQIDLTPPTTTITETNPSASPSSSNTRELVFVASESSSFQCSLDDAAFASCASPVALENLSEGWHRLEIRAIDSTGNVGPAAAATWESDYTAPTVTIASAVPAAGNTNATNFAVEFSSNETSNFLCSIDDADAEACTSPFSGIFAADGSHTVSIVAVDLSGLRSQAQSVTWSVDTSAAVISFASILPSASARLNANDMEFTVQSAEPVTLVASLDGADAEPISASVLYANLAEGQHSLTVTGTDSFGNQLNTITHAFFVDRTAPTVQLAAEISGKTAQTVNSFTFSANEEATFECELDGAGFAGCSSVTMISGLAEGAHQYRVRATDGAGNVSAIASTSWTIDYTAPTTSVTSTQLGSTSFRFDFTSSEENSTFLCSFDNEALAPCTSPLTKSGLSVGSHSLIVHAVDSIGNRDLAGAQIAVQVEEVVQTFLNNPGVILTNQKQMTFEFSSNLSNATFLCSLDGAAATPCTSPQTYTNLADGPHTFSVKAVSASGVADSNPKTHSWSVDSASPLILTATTTATTTTISVTWTTNEPATAQLKWGLGFTLTNTTAETGFATSHSVVLNGLNPNTVYSIQVTGRDAAGNVYQGPQQSIRTRFF